MKTNKIEKTLTKTELDLLKTIGKNMLEDLEKIKTKESVRELMVSYSKALDLSGDSTWLAKELLEEDILKVEDLEELTYNSLALIRLIYLDGVTSCDKLLDDYAVRGLWEAIKTRRSLLVSTLSKVDQELDRQDAKFSEGTEEFSLPDEPSDKTVFQEFTPRKIEELSQGTGVTFEELDMAIYTLRDLGETVGYTKEGFLYLYTLLGEEYLTPKQLVEAAKEEYKAAEEDDSYLE